MATLEIVLSLASIGASAYLVLAELSPPRPARPPKPSRAAPPPKPKRREARVAKAAQVAPAPKALRGAATPAAPRVAPPEPRRVAPAFERVHTTRDATPAERLSMLESLSEVEHDEGARGWRRASSALALLVMTLAVAAVTGAGIYRGLLAFKR